MLVLSINNIITCENWFTYISKDLY